MPRDIGFPYDREKAKQVVHWWLARHDGRMEKMKLIKLVFYADRAHLAEHGRPIVGGCYCAMQHGPVSSSLLDDLKPSRIAEALTCTSPDGRKIVAGTPTGTDRLSESDVEALSQIDHQYGKLSASRLRKMTHSLAAWKRNYPDESISTSCPLPYDDFFLDLSDNSILGVIREEQEVRDFFL